jgi:hypothetical protein
MACSRCLPGTDLFVGSPVLGCGIVLLVMVCGPPGKGVTGEVILGTVTRLREMMRTVEPGPRLRRIGRPGR